MASKTWTEEKLNPLKIHLDPENPRIEVAGDVTQDGIRAKLLAHEEVVELAIKIAAFGGLLPGERVIVCKENGKTTVVEGNRRVCACQLLLKPELIPEKYRKRFPIASQELKNTLNEINADIAPNRDAAEPIITMRHTEPGVKSWRTTAKMRRASKLLEAGYDITQIAEKLSQRQSNIRVLIQEYRLLRFVLDLDHRAWNQVEIDRLTDQTLPTNPYTRFFTLAGVKERLGLSFDENNHIVTTLPKNVFEQYMQHIARCFFIPESAGKKPWANTRTTPDQVFANFQLKLKGHVGKFHADVAPTVIPLNSGGRGVNGGAKPNGGGQKTNAPKSAKASVFFEKLICAVDDDRLIALTNEIKNIDHRAFPIAAAMLLRALFESALTYQTKRAKKFNELNKKNNGRDVGLETLIKFCANKQNGIFQYLRACDALSAFGHVGIKDHLDFVVHGRWMEASASMLETSARTLRPLIKHIIEDTESDLEDENV